MFCLAPMTLAAALLQPAVEGPAEPPSAPSTAAPTAARREADWSAERRRLRLHTGLSGAFAGAMLVTGILLLVGPDGCQGPNCEGNVARILSGAVVLGLTPIPIATGIYWGVRLHRHERKRPAMTFHPRAGGFALQF